MSAKDLRQYKKAFNEHIREFFDGFGASDDFNSTQLVVEEELEENDIEGTNGWSEREKDQFFEFLGRYGIRQIEKIQSKIKTKSVVQIRNYFDILQTALHYYKNHRRFFKRLTKYQQFPAAVEVDEISIAAEDEVSSKVIASELITIDQNKQINADPLSDQPEEDQLIDFSKFVEMSQFYYSLSHLHNNPIIPKVIPNEVKIYLNQLVKEIVVLFMEKLILNKTMNGSKKLQFTDNKTKELSLALHLTDVKSMFPELNLKRTLLKVPFIYEMGDRLDFEILDPQPLMKSQLENDVFDFYGRRVKDLVEWFLYSNRRFYYSEKNIDECLKRLTDFEQEKNKICKIGTILDNIATEEESKVGKFIIGNEDDDLLLDNDLAWLIVSIETQKCDDTDFRDQQFYQRLFLHKFGLLRSYNIIQSVTKANSEKEKIKSLLLNPNLFNDVKQRTQSYLKSQNDILTDLEQQLVDAENKEKIEKEILRIKRNIVNEKKSIEIFSTKMLAYHRKDYESPRRMRKVPKKLEKVKGLLQQSESNGVDHNSLEDIDLQIKALYSTNDDSIDREDTDYYSDLFIEEIPENSEEDEEYDDEGEEELNGEPPKKKQRITELQVDKDYEHWTQTAQEQLKDLDLEERYERYKFIDRYQNKTIYPSPTDDGKEEQSYRITPAMLAVHGLSFD